MQGRQYLEFNYFDCGFNHDKCPNDIDQANIDISVMPRGLQQGN